MGLTYTSATVGNLSKQGSPYSGEFLVDTGAIDCLVPANTLIEAGIEVEGTALYELASGEPVEYEYGFARISIDGEETVAQVVFGPDGSSPIIGVVTLENMGLVVDPVTKTLKKLHAKPLK